MVPAASHPLVLLFTGDGKGKTTAALGLALRAVGQGLRVAMIQFIKGDEDTGECKAASRLGAGFTLMTMGAGFVFGDWTEADVAAAREAWDAGRQALSGGDYDVVILDELCFVVKSDVVTASEVVEALGGRGPGVHVVITGRAAPEALIEAADLVTEMRCLKHPYDAGVGPQKGIEF